MDKDIVYAITFEGIQAGAEEIIGRKLTKSELGDVAVELESSPEIEIFIREAIERVIDFRKILKRNRNANKNPQHFRVYWKNTNLFQKEFKLRFWSKNLPDAKAYIKNYTDSCGFDAWRIAEYKNGTEREIEIIEARFS